MKQYHRTIAIGAVLLVLCTLASCATTTPKEGGIAPIHPIHGSTSGSLQPNFEWEPAQEKDVGYDLIIFEEIDDPNATAQSKKKFETVYYRENINGTSHKTEDTLKAKQTYYWSVRTRKDDKTGEWSAVITQAFTGVSYHKRTRNFRFTTPDR